LYLSLASVSLTFRILSIFLWKLVISDLAFIEHEVSIGAL
jgi:hypothetical protein